MKTRKCFRILCFLLCACLLLTGCGEEIKTPEEETVSIWLVEGELLSAELTALAAQFNNGSFPVKAELRAFANEEELGAALDSARPDLILCGHERAVALHEQGRLRDVSSGFTQAPAFSESFLTLSDCVGSAFFPIGAETELLVLNGPAFDQSAASALGRETITSIEGLCAAASACGGQGQLFFTADSFTALFTLALGPVGSGFSGVREQDIFSEDYKRVDNLLAEAAYEGGLSACDSPALSLTESGEVVCALVSSTGLTGELGGELELYPLAGPAGGFARAVGLAVTSPFSGREQAIAKFLSWLLQPQRAAELALDRGLIPAVTGWTPEEPGTLDAALLSLSSAELYFPPLDSGCFRTDGEFEYRFRAALEMLK